MAGQDPGEAEGSLSNPLSPARCRPDSLGFWQRGETVGGAPTGGGPIQLSLPGYSESSNPTKRGPGPNTHLDWRSKLFIPFVGGDAAAELVMSSPVFCATDAIDRSENRARKEKGVAQ